MSSKNSDTATERTPDNTVSRSTFTLLMISAVEVTWRMFVPTLGLFFLGMWIDSMNGSKPWFMVGGLIVGFALSIALVYQQIEETSKR